MFRLPLRHTEGFLRSVLAVMRTGLESPDRGSAASCAPSPAPAQSAAPPRARSTPPHRRCAALPHRAPLDTSLPCSTKPSECSVDHSSGLVFRCPHAASHRRSVVYFCSAVLSRGCASANRALRTELKALADQTRDRAAYLRPAETLSAFLARLHEATDTLDILERQRIVRLVVKGVLVDDDTIVIRHSIPVSSGPPHRGSSP